MDGSENDTFFYKDIYIKRKSVNPLNLTLKKSIYIDKKPEVLNLWQYYLIKARKKNRRNMLSSILEMLSWQHKIWPSLVEMIQKYYLKATGTRWYHLFIIENLNPHHKQQRVTATLNISIYRPFLPYL